MLTSASLPTDADRAAVPRQEWAQFALAEAARREAAFAACAPARQAERHTRLAAWAERESLSAAELAAECDLHEVMDEAIRRRRMDLPPRNEAERALYRQWAELDADAEAGAAEAAWAEIAHEHDPAAFNADQVGIDIDGLHPGVARDEAEAEA
jgi:hypothetical protein